MDTDTVVAAMRSPKGASAALILAVDDGRVTLLATVPLFIGRLLCGSEGQGRPAGLPPAHNPRRRAAAAGRR